MFNRVKHVCNNTYMSIFAAATMIVFFVNDALVTFIDITHPSDPLKREDYWRSTLKTMAPLGLNNEESV